MGGGGVWRWGKREIIYLPLHCQHQNDSCIKMGSDECHFNVSLTALLIGLMVYVDIKHHKRRKKLRSCVAVEVVVLGSPSLWT